MHAELNSLISEIEDQGIRDDAVLEALKKTDRKLFVPPSLHNHAYENRPLPIGEDQTISQPFIVAYTAQELYLNPNDKVLEIGSGSGYQAAVLSHLCESVYGIEIIESLCDDAKEKMERLMYNNVHLKCDDGHRGWAEKAPFQKILISAAGKNIPRQLIHQLDTNGILIMPLMELSEETSEEFQYLVRLTKTSEGLLEEVLIPVRYVSLTQESDYVF